MPLKTLVTLVLTAITRFVFHIKDYNNIDSKGHSSVHGVKLEV